MTVQPTGTPPTGATSEGGSESPLLSTVTVTEAATTVEVLVDHTSGSGHDTTIPVAIIGAGAVIIAAAIAATSAIVVAKVSKGEDGGARGNQPRRRAPRRH